MLSFKALVIVIAGVCAAGAAVGNAIWGPRARARRRLREGSTTLADREVVTLTGTVRSTGDLLESPLSGKRCVMYEILTHVRAPAGNHTDSVADLQDRRMISFALDIGDDVVIVEGDMADLEIPPSPVIPRKLEREIALLDAYGHPVELVRTSSFEEVIVAPGDRVSVHGMAIVELDATATAERGYREGAPRKVRLVAHAAHPLTIGRPQRR